MKARSLIVSFLVIVCCCDAARATEIRHFTLKTKESLGRQLYERTRRAAEPLTELQQRAKRAAMGALRQLDRRYRFVVLDDPDGSGYLVYALDTSPNPDDIVVGVHFRVSVSSDGKVERVDQLARGPLVIRKNGPDMPSGYKHAGFYATNMVSTEPVETFVYVSLLHSTRCAVGTLDGAVWFIENGKITKDKGKR